MDTIFQIFDLVINTKVYLLKNWGSEKPDHVASWKYLVLTGIGGALVCDYDVDNLKWIGKVIVNSIPLDLWGLIEKDLLIRANGPYTYKAVILKIQQVRLSAIHNIVDELRKMPLIKEHGQYIEKSRFQMIETTRRIVGSGSDPSDIASIVAQCFIGYDVLALKLEALKFYDFVNDNPIRMERDIIVWKLNTKYQSLESHNL